MVQCIKKAEEPIHLDLYVLFWGEKQQMKQTIIADLES